MPLAMDDNGPTISVAGFERFAGYTSRNKELLASALVSKGFPNEHPGLAVLMDQTVLSNMGDAVIDLLATEHLIVHRGLRDVGTITDRRKRMVSRSALNLVATLIVQFLSITSGERRILHDSSIAGEYLEAMVGALHIDGGLSPAQQLLNQLGFFEIDQG